MSFDMYWAETPSDSLDLTNLSRGILAASPEDVPAAYEALAARQGRKDVHVHHAVVIDRNLGVAYVLQRNPEPPWRVVSG